LPEYDVVDEENNHLAFTSTVQAEAIAVRDALNAVARGSAHRGAPEPSGEFHDAKFPWASSALLAYGRAEWACGKRHTREDHPEGRCPDVDAALGAVGGIEPAQERALLRRWLHSVAPRAVEGRAETFDALIADTKSLLEGVAPAPAPEPHMLDLSRIKYDEEWQMLAGMHASELRAALKMLARAQAEGEA
jgi:hypothetical protein